MQGTVTDDGIVARRSSLRSSKKTGTKEKSQRGSHAVSGAIESIHEALAEKVFEAAILSGVYVGQIRTRLGIAGSETEGPQDAARALFALMSEDHQT